VFIREVEKGVYQINMQVYDIDNTIATQINSYLNIKNSFSWKITKPVRFIGKILRKILKHKKREV
jgi:hypothetical protein